MFERDYLVRQLLLFFQAMTRSWHQKEESDPRAAADTLEEAISAATDLDGATLLSLSPETISQVLRVSGVDPKVVSYIAHGMLLESVYLTEAGDVPLAGTRRQQALALSQSYGFSLPEDPTDIDAANPEKEERRKGECPELLDIDDLAALL